MTTPFDLTMLLEALPPTERAAMESLRDATLGRERLATVALIGPFSVGKSTLANKLLGDEILPRSLEETTALPTFIEDADATSFLRVGADGALHELSRAEFASLARTGSREGGALIWRTQAPWLRGATLVDLPGLGGTDPSRAALTRAQIESADVVFYMLAPRGPTREDLEMLGWARAQRKRVHVLVGQWDTTRGQRTPDLDAWASNLSPVVGHRPVLLPVAHDGTGFDELKQLLARDAKDIATIRADRFRAGAVSMLASALRSMDASRAALAGDERARDEAAAVTAQHRREILQTHESLGRRRDEAAEASRRRLEDAAAIVRRTLEDRLASLSLDTSPSAITSSWEAFVDMANEAAEEATASLLDAVDDTYRKDLATNRAASWSAVSVEVLLTPEVERGAWRAAMQIEEASVVLAQLSESSDRALIPQPEVSAQELDQLRERLSELRAQHEDLARREIPLVARESSPQGWRTFGRFIGEVADLALLFVDPAAVGVKIASFLGKSKGARQAGRAVRHLVEASQGMRQMPRAGGSDERLLSTIDSFAEKLSLAYWGEQLGGWFDGPAQAVYEADPEAAQALDAARASIAQNIAATEARLREAETNGRKSEESAYAQELRRRERDRLEAELAAARRRREALEAEAQEVHRVAVLQARERLVARTLRAFDQRARVLGRELDRAIRSWWDTEVRRALASRDEELAVLLARLNDAEAGRAAAIASLDTRSETLKSALARLGDAAAP